MAAAVRGLSPVSMTAFFTPRSRRAEHVLRLLPQGIGDAEHGGEHSIDGQIQLGILRGQGVELRLLPLRDYALLVFKDEVGDADAHLLSVHRTGDAMGHQVFYLGVALLMV